MKKLLAMMTVVTAIACGVWFSLPGKAKPWWYTGGNQLDWELAHEIVPAGYDEVSAYIIRLEGIRAFGYDHEQICTYVFNHDTVWEWVGDKLLVRWVDGRAGFFSGHDETHYPLVCDPREAKKPLHECLAKE